MDQEPRWLNPAERRAWLGLVAIAELLPSVLDSQLRRDSSLTLFEYQTLAMLSEEPTRTLQMTELAERTNSTLPRLSHVITRMSERGLVARTSCPTDARARNVVLTEAGWEAIVAAAPGHVRTAREAALDGLSPQQIDQLGSITASLLGRLDPDGRINGRWR